MRFQDASTQQGVVIKKNASIVGNINTSKKGKSPFGTRNNAAAPRPRGAETLSRVTMNYTTRAPIFLPVLQWGCGNEPPSTKVHITKRYCYG